MCLFKGTRHVELLHRVIRSIVGAKTWHMLLTGDPLLLPQHVQNPGGMFCVHMVVVTCCIGRPLAVNEGCILETVITHRLSHCISLVSRSDEETNSVILTVTNWEIVLATLARISGSTSEFEHSKCKTGSASDSESLKCKADPQQHKAGFTHTLMQCDNTVSVTAKGALILRMSWVDPATWDERLRDDVYKACATLAQLLSHCC